MRALVRDLLVQLVVPATAGVDGYPLPDDRVHSGADILEQPDFPFVVHKIAAAPATPSGRTQNSLEVWVYDEPGSWHRIDRMLNQVVTLITAVPHAGADGAYIAAADFVSFSPDLAAEEYHGITRMATFTLVGRNPA